MATWSTSYFHSQRAAPSVERTLLSHGLLLVTVTSMTRMDEEFRNLIGDMIHDKSCEYVMMSSLKVNGSGRSLLCVTMSSY